MEQNHIKIKGKDFVIDDKIAVTNNSRFIDADEIIVEGTKINRNGPLTYPIKLNATGELNDILNHIDKYQKKKVHPDIDDVILFSNGQLIDKGKIRVLQVEKDLANHLNTRYQISFISNNPNEYMNTIKNKKLKDLVMNGIISIPTVNTGGPSDPAINFQNVEANSITGWMDFKVGYQDPGDDPHYPYDGLSKEYTHYEIAQTAVHIDNLIFDSPNDYFCFPSALCQANENMSNTWINFIDSTLANDFRVPTYKKTLTYLGPTTERQYYKYEALKNMICPMYYYHQVLKHCFSEFGYNLSDPFVDDEYFKTLTIFNSYDILNREMVWFGNLFGLDLLNLPTANDYVWYHELETEINPKNHLPDLLITDFLKDFMLKFNCYFDIKDRDVSIVFNKMETIGNEISQINPKAIINYDLENGLNLKYDLSETDKSYFTTIQSNFTLEDIQDETGFSGYDIGAFYKNKGNNYIYKKVSSSMSDSVAICPNIVQYYTGSGKEITMPVIPVNHDFFNYVLYYEGGHFGNTADNVVVPYINRTVSIKPIKKWNFTFLEGEPDFFTESPRVILYHRYQFANLENNDRVIGDEIPQIGFFHGIEDTGYSSASGRYYPYMSHHNYKAGTVGAYGNWHLGLVGSESLTRIFWREFLNVFNNHRRIIFKALMNWQEIKNFKWNEATLIYGGKYYIGSINFELPIKDQVQVEAYEL